MSIERISGVNYINPYAGVSEVHRAAENTKVQKNDSIEISEASKALTGLSCDFQLDHTQKIEEIKAQIQNGTYVIDAQATASAMLRAMKGV